MTDFDALLTSPEYARNPYPTYQRLREEAPVYWCAPWNCWILTRYDDITRTLQNHHDFTCLGRLTAAMSLPEPMQAQFQALIRHYSQGLINVDPPDHTRMRQLVHQAFTPRTIRRLSEHIEAIVEGLLDGVAERGEMDVIWDSAYPLPVTVIAELMGLPASDHAVLKGWSRQIVEFMATPRPTPEVLGRSQDALLELQSYFRAIFRQRRQTSQDDLITGLVQAELEGQRLTEEEMISTCVTILIGGHETTTFLISSGVLALLTFPDQLHRLRQKPDLAASAVEECLRYEGPFQRNRRLATRDVELGGQMVREGQFVMQMLGAANRAPAQFHDPDRFDIERTPNRHVAFGYGPHFCLGAPLARLEAPIALNTILRRFSDLELACSDLRWLNTVFRGLESLPITFRQTPS